VPLAITLPCSNKMAHSCRHCQKLRIAPPTAAEGENWVSVLTVNVGIVRSAALDGCAFFQWCLSQHPKTVAESAQKRLEEFQDAPLLRVLMGSESSSRPRCKFVTFQWESPAGEEFRIRSLYILTEEGASDCPIFDSLHESSIWLQVTLLHMTTLRK
jgi:hypothetical protein